MPRIKSLVIRAEVDEAKAAHNCQGNTGHRLQRNDTRLKVRNGRSWDHYCLECAIKIVERDIDRLRKLADQLEARNHNMSGL